MKRQLMFCVALLVFFLSTSRAQFDSLWRGAFLFGAHNVNTVQMEDSLHLNAFQTSTGYDSSEDSLFFGSTQHMRVINQRKKLGDWTTNPNDPGRASGQRMIYEAELTEPPRPLLWNYFRDKVGRIPPGEDTAWQIRVGVNSRGYMVESGIPNNEYHYNRTNYLATFRLKVDAPYELEDTVVNCIITCAGNGGERAHLILLGDRFDSAGAWREFTIPFTISFPLSATEIPSGSHFLTGGMMSSDASAGQAVAPCGGIDLQVYWYGYVTTYLDKVTVQDSIALRLFAGVYDQEIAGEAQICAGKSQHERFHLVDEPYISAFQAFEYVGRKITQAVGSTLGVRAGSVTPQYHDFERFLIDSNTPELLIDPYFVSSDIPHPSIDSSEATRSGIAQWSYDTYVDRLQYKLDWFLTNFIAPAANQAKIRDMPLVHIPQLHGILWESTNQYRTSASSPDLRPPSPSEIRLSYSMVMAYGAKGFLAYPLSTSTWWSGVVGNSERVGFPGLAAYALVNGYMDHSSNTEELFNGHGAVWTGYVEKWAEVASINQRLSEIGDTLLALDWVGAKSWTTTNTHTADWDSVVANITTRDTLGNADNTVYVEVGHLKRQSTTNYAVVVNRRSSTRTTAGEYDTRDITVTLNLPTIQNRLVTDIETNRAWVTKGNGTFTDRFQPGEGKIYRLQAATVGGTQTFSQLKFIGGGVLTLTSNANITARGNMDTVNVVLGSNATFKADTGSTMVIARDSAVVWESGSQLEVSGTLTTSDSVYMLVPSGATLSLHPRANVRLGSPGNLSSEGTFSARGTAANPVQITSAHAGDDVVSVNINLPSGIDTLEYCRISRLRTGVILGHATATLRHNRFVNCDIAVSSDGWKWSPVIEDNVVDSCRIGFDVYTSSTIGMPTIHRDTIRACTYGMIVNPSYGSSIDSNRLSDNHIGVLVINSGPVLHGNIIEDGDSLGVYCLSGAHPRFGDTLLQDPGNNVIRNNAASQVYAIDSDPFFGVGMERVFGGFNSVYAPTEEVPLITAELNSYVIAHSNWWGTENPNEKQFVTDGKAIIDYSYPLASDPNSGMRPFGASASNEKGAKSDDPPLMTLSPQQIQLRQAMVLRALRKYGEAVAVYANLISTNPNARESRYALAELRNTYHDYLQWSGDTTLQATLETYLRAQISNHPNVLIKRIAKTLKAGEIGIRRDFSAAIEEYQQLLQSATVDEDRRMCLFALFNINAFGLRDRNEAQLYLTQLQNQFPNDARTGIAAIRFRAMVDRSRNSGLQKSPLAGTTQQIQLPLEFSLSQNYPNPFNPSTTIKYDLPVDAHATLKLYDVLGREVLTLVNEQAKAGYHFTTLDASRFSSGVYFYRIHAGQFSQTKKLILLR